MVSDGTHRKLRNVLIRSDLTQAQRKAAQKDFHLISAALSTDQTILSNDNEARKIFALAATEVVQFQKLIWVNPCNDHEQCIQWLVKGAKPEQQRFLFQD
jgi:hypothetical protein